MNGHSHWGRQGGLIQHTLIGLRATLQTAMYADNSASRRGLLQPLDPRVKVAGLLSLIGAAALSTRLWVIAAIFGLAVLLAALSHLSFPLLATRIWIATLTFSGPLALPALFLTPGRPLYVLPGLSWAISAPGLASAGYLILRAETTATLGLLLVFTTPWNHVLKALRLFRVPVVFVVILSMTCRYILLLLETAHEMFLSRQSRTVGPLTRGEERRLAVASAGVLLSRTFQLSGEVYLAMQSRGFRGEVYLLDDFRMTATDWLAASAFATLVIAFVWLGR